MKKHTCHLDLHLRSHYVTIGQRRSRSQEISVNSFNEELCSSDRSGPPDITQDVISVQTREQTHDRSGGNLINTSLQYKTTLKYIMRSKRSTPTMSSFVKELRKTWTSTFQDYHILP